MSKKEDEALEASLKYGSGPVELRQGSVNPEFFDKYGVGPVIVADPEVPATPESATAATEKES